MTSHRRPISKSCWGFKASNGNHGRSGGPSRGRGLDDGERTPPGDSAEAGAAATGGLDDGERAPPCGSAEAGAKWGVHIFAYVAYNFHAYIFYIYLHILCINAYECIEEILMGSLHIYAYLCIFMHI